MITACAVPIDEAKFFRPFPVRKEVLDTVNSVAWFLADAFWMLQLREPAYLFIAPTIATGLALLYIDRRASIFFINLAILSWILMNTLWMSSDFERIPALMSGARGAFFAGLACIAAAAATSTNLRDTFSHFKRFRVLKG